MKKAMLLVLAASAPIACASALGASSESAIVRAHASAASVPTPLQAARATRRCLMRFNWKARYADIGRTVNAKAPRKLRGYPYHPFYSVAFYGWRFGRRAFTGWNENRMSLNRKENRTATYCRKAAWR